MKADVACGWLKAFECELCKIKPSAIKCPTGQWTKDARAVFSQLITKATDYYATVSIVDALPHTCTPQS